MECVREQPNNQIKNQWIFYCVKIRIQFFILSASFNLCKNNAHTIFLSTLRASRLHHWIAANCGYVQEQREKKKSKLISGGKLVFGYPQREAIFSHNFFYSASSLSRPPPLSLFSDFFPTARHRRFLLPRPLRSYTHTHWSLTARVKAVMVATSLVCFSCVYNFPSNWQALY